MSFNPHESVGNNEFLYRIIRPFPDHWNYEENRLSSGAFKSSVPISVDRDGGREENDIINFIWNFHSENSGIAKLSYLSCIECDTIVTAIPIISQLQESAKTNSYHALINGKGIIGTKGQHGKCLNKKAVIVKKPDLI